MQNTWIERNRSEPYTYQWFCVVNFGIQKLLRKECVICDKNSHDISLSIDFGKSVVLPVRTYQNHRSKAKPVPILINSAVNILEQP